MATDVEFAVSRIASVNPATGEVLGELDSAGPTEVRAAVARARTAQPDWNAWGIRNRVRVMRRFQQILLAHKTDIARRITQEAGKPAVEALLTEVLVVLDAARFLIDNAFAILREEKLPHGNLAVKTKSGRILHEPYGVVGMISPWNYPFSIPATETMAALVAGNAVVLKPSELRTAARYSSTMCVAPSRRTSTHGELFWAASRHPRRFILAQQPGRYSAYLFAIPYETLQPRCC